MSKPRNYVYVVMDGRANYDLHRASVLEVIDEVNAERAFHQYLKEYVSPGIDSVLVRYKAEGSTLTSPKIIDSWADLR